MNKEIDKIFAEEDALIRQQKKSLFNYPAFKKAVKKAKRILYLADNAGEIVFDRILLEQLSDKKIIFAVRGKPIINDA